MIGARSGQGKARSRNEIGAQESFEDDGCIHIYCDFFIDGFNIIKLFIQICLVYYT